jgi:hypothetical protein
MRSRRRTDSPRYGGSTNQSRIYGLAQAGRRWQRTLFDWFKAWGLKQCQHDTCVFVRNSSVNTSNGPREDTLIAGCFIDDLHVAYNSSDAVSLIYTPSSS